MSEFSEAGEVVDSVTQNQRAWMIPIFLFRGLAVLCCLVLPTMESGPSSYLPVVCCGIILAQVELIVLWSALGCTDYKLRIPAAVAAAALLFVWWMAGYAWEIYGNPYSSSFWQIVSPVTLCLPLFFIATQALLWLPRVLWGWRIERRPQPACAGERSPVTLRHLMLATAVLAVSLALMRQVFVDDPANAIGMVLAATAVSVVNLLFTLPFVRLLLSSRGLWLGLLATALYPAVICGLTILGFSVADSVTESQGRLVMPYQFRVLLAVLMSSFSASMILVLLCARAMGYRLRRSRDDGGRTGVDNASVQGGTP